MLWGSWGGKPLHQAYATYLCSSFPTFHVLILFLAFVWVVYCLGVGVGVSGLSELMPEELKRGPIVRLGRPYRDVWAEESYIEALEERARDADGLQQQVTT